jgi:hypothetical protein
LLSEHRVAFQHDDGKSGRAGRNQRAKDLVKLLRFGILSVNRKNDQWAYCEQ